ncbi:hypothetical protein BHE74_00056699, partial [Ensete ventricosum]
MRSGACQGYRELAEGIRSLPGWCKGVRRKKTETRWKIVGGSRKACRELGRIGKLTGNTPGDHRRKTVRLATRIPEAIGLAGQAPDTLGELPTHSKHVPNRIILTPARCLDLTLAKPLIII